MSQARAKAEEGTNHQWPPATPQQEGAPDGKCRGCRTQSGTSGVRTLARRCLMKTRPPDVCASPPRIFASIVRAALRYCNIATSYCRSLSRFILTLEFKQSGSWFSSREDHPLADPVLATANGAPLPGADQSATCMNAPLSAWVAASDSRCPLLRPLATCALAGAYVPRAVVPAPKEPARNATRARGSPHRSFADITLTSEPVGCGCRRINHRRGLHLEPNAPCLWGG
jgi:hypothetical protein